LRLQFNFMLSKRCHIWSRLSQRIIVYLCRDSRWPTSKTRHHLGIY